MAEAPHGTAPALQGKDVANPLAMILAAAATLRYAGERHRPDADRGSRAIYEAALETVASGCKTPDLGGHAGTTEFTTEVVSRVRTKLEVWSSLGSAARSPAWRRRPAAGAKTRRSWPCASAGLLPAAHGADRHRNLVSEGCGRQRRPTRKGAQA